MTVRILVDYTAGGVPRCEYATTLGAGGLFIETESPPPRGTVLKVRFRLGPESPLHTIESRVVWARPPAEAGATAPGMGLAFLNALASSQLAAELEQMAGGRGEAPEGAAGDGEA